jgi:hypothetical protein
MSGANAVGEIADLVLRNCKEGDGRIRAEDAISTAAAIVGEACLTACGELSPDEHDLVPGQPIASDAVNRVLGIDGTGWDSSIQKSPLGILQAAAPMIGFSASDIPKLEPIFQNFASSIGRSPQSKGSVPLTVPEENRPRVMPLRAAFELRSKLNNLYQARGTSSEDRPLVCTGALAQILGMTRNALAPRIALTLAYETLIGMAKTVPMAAKHLSGAVKQPHS